MFQFSLQIVRVSSQISEILTISETMWLTEKSIIKLNRCKTEITEILAAVYDNTNNQPVSLNHWIGTKPAPTQDKVRKLELYQGLAGSRICRMKRNEISYLKQVSSAALVTNSQLWQLPESQPTYFQSQAQTRQLL